MSKLYAAAVGLCHGSTGLTAASHACRVSSMDIHALDPDLLHQQTHFMHFLYWPHSCTLVVRHAQSTGQAELRLSHFITMSSFRLMYTSSYEMLGTRLCSLQPLLSHGKVPDTRSCTFQRLPAEMKLGSLWLQITGHLCSSRQQLQSASRFQRTLLLLACLQHCRSTVACMLRGAVLHLSTATNMFCLLFTSEGKLAPCYAVPGSKLQWPGWQAVSWHGLDYQYEADTFHAHASVL